MSGREWHPRRSGTGELFQKARPAANTPPSGGFQFFGQVDIDRRSKDMLVALKDINGAAVFSTRLRARPPHGRPRWEWDDE